jgi:hypothetical protein
MLEDENWYKEEKIKGGIKEKIVGRGERMTKNRKRDVGRGEAEYLRQKNGRGRGERMRRRK